MLTAEQLAGRKIGGSDVPTILGLNPYQTAEELRLEIAGRLPRFEGNDASEAGEAMEDGIRNLYAKRFNRKVRRAHRTIVNPKYPWLTVHIDGQIEGERRGLEIKNIHWRSAFLWGPDGTDEIAEHYFGQPHAYMLVMDFPRWDVAAYFGGWELRVYPLERDPEIDQIIIEATHDFWHKHVLADVPCPIDPAQPGALRAIQKAYPGTDGSTITFGDDIASWHAVRKESLALAKRYEATADTAKFHILSAMGESAIGVLPDGSRYTRKMVTRKGYQVDESSYIDFRHSNRKGLGAPDDE